MYKEVGTIKKSIYYGTALMLYHLGYLYKKYANVLPSNSNNIQDMVDSYAVETSEQSLSKAKSYFLEAAELFTTQLNHIKGIQLTKQHLAELYDENSEERKNAETEAKKYKELFTNFVHENGLMSCVHLPRMSGEDFSLLTEIVKMYQGILFKRNKAQSFAPEEFDWSPIHPDRKTSRKSRFGF